MGPPRYGKHGPIQKPVLPQNHPMFGSIDEWFYRSLLGINGAAPGFEKLIIRPQPVAGLTWARGSYASIRGKIDVDWSVTGHQLILKTTVPANTSAEIWIPSADGIA